MIRKELVITISNPDGEKEEDFNNFFNRVKLMVRNYDIVISSYEGKSHINSDGDRQCDVFQFYLGISPDIVEEEQEKIVQEILDKLKQIRRKYRKTSVSIILGEIDFI